MKDVDVKLPVTDEVFTFEGRIDYQNVAEAEVEGYTISIGNTVDVYLGRDNLYHVFSGRLDKKTKKIEGQYPRWLDISGKGWGDYCVQRYTRGYYLGSIHDVISTIVSPLVPTYIATVDAVTSTTLTELDWSNQEGNIWEAVRKVCNNNDWDFYVDNGSTLHAFPIGHTTSSIDISNKLYNLTYEQDSSRMINSQLVIGKLGKTFGSDAVFTEAVTGDTVNWGNAVASGSSITATTLYKVEGDKSIWNYYSDGSGTVWMESSFPTTLDLKWYGNLSFYLQYHCESTIHIDDEQVTLKLLWKQDESNYFFNTVNISSGKVISGQIYPIEKDIYWMYFTRFNVPFNLLEESPYSKTGNPSWGSIKAIRFQVVSPLSSSGKTCDMYIDGMKFNKGRYSGGYQDNTSIGNYGEHRGKVIINEVLDSDTKCDNLGQQIVTMWKDPTSYVKDAETWGEFSINPGEECTIGVSEISDTIIVREIHHQLRDLDLRTYFDYAPKYIPRTERIIANLTQDMERSKQKDIEINLSPSALSRYIAGPLGEEDIIISASPDNILKNPSFEWDINLDDIPDFWNVSKTSGCTFSRDMDNVLDGRYSAKMTFAGTADTGYIQSHTFPASRQTQYIVSGAFKGGGSSVDLTLLCYDKTLNPISTLIVCNTISVPSNWSRRERKIWTPNSVAFSSVKSNRYASTIGTIYWDDFRVIKIKDVPERRMFFGIYEYVGETDTLFTKWMTNGTIDINPGLMQLTTSGSADAEVRYYPTASYFPIPFNRDLKLTFVSSLNLSGGTIHMCLAAPDFEQNIGFKLVGSTLVTITGDADNFDLQTLSTTLANSIHIFEAQLYPNNRCDFYVNGTFQSSHNTLPTVNRPILWWGVQGPNNTVDLYGWKIDTGYPVI